MRASPTPIEHRARNRKWASGWHLVPRGRKQAASVAHMLIPFIKAYSEPLHHFPGEEGMQGYKGAGRYSRRHPPCGRKASLPLAGTALCIALSTCLLTLLTGL